MRKIPSQIWYGTEESWHLYEQAVTLAAQLEAGGKDAIANALQMRGVKSGGDMFALPPMWQMEGDTAVLHVNGSLINGEAGFYRLFGIVGYGDIQGALAEIAVQKGVKRVLLSIDSGGGDVSGLETTGNMVRKMAERMPVVSFSDGSMMSAAYWLGASADKIILTQTAMAGSVGTMIVHTEYSEMLKKDGVNKTVITYGKYKGLGNPFEPLSEEGKKKFQALADESGKIFVDYVSDRRGVSAEEFQKTMGEGRVFMGRKAAEVGLVDGIMLYDEALAFAKSLDTSKTSAQNPRNSSKDSAMKANLSKLTVLAIASGVALDQLGLDKPEANAQGIALEAAAQAAVVAEATEVHAAVQALVAKEVTKATGEKTGEIATLKATNETLTAKVTLLEGGAAQLTAKVSAAEALIARSEAVVKASVGVMSVALGGSATAADSLTGEALLAEHDRLAAQFKTKFKAGGVAAVPGLPKDSSASAEGPSPEFLTLLGKGKAA